MKEIFKLSKREKKIAEKAMNEAVVREFTEEEIEALMKYLTLTKGKIRKSFMKYGAELEKEEKLEEALEGKIPFDARARRDKESLMRYKKLRAMINHNDSYDEYINKPYNIKLQTAAESYRKKLMENMKESEGTKHYSFMISGGRIYNPEEFKKVIDENIKKAGSTYSEQFLKIKKKEIKKNRKKFKKLMRIANEGANEIMNDSLTYNRKLKELIDSNVEFDKKLKPIPEEMVIREKKALKSIKL